MSQPGETAPPPDELVVPAEKVERFKELCRTNERFFIESCISIVDRDTNAVVPFQLNDVQNIYEREKTAFDIILKSRKLGMSTRLIASDIWACAFRHNQHAVLINQDKPATLKMLETRVKPMLRSIKFPLNYTERRDCIIFNDTHSRYYVGTAGTKEFGRGSDITRYHLSECSYYASQAIITGIEEACVGDAVGRLETTANGTNFFMRIWKAAQQGNSRYKPIFIPWWRDPVYTVKGATISNLTEKENQLIAAFNLTYEQLAWRRAKIKGMSNPDLFDQEYPDTAEAAFISSGRLVFDWVSLVNFEKLVENSKWRGNLRDTGDTVEFFPEEKGKFYIWEHPVRNHQYVVGADIAEGLTDGAYSTAFVLDLNTSAQVAEWHGRIPPDRFADLLARVGSYYNTGLLVPESWPGPGNVTTLRLLDIGYRNIWRRPARSNRNNPEQLWGWETTGRTRPLMFHELAAAIRDYRLHIKSRGLLEEMRSIIYDDGGDMTSQAGCYSDRVMACGIAWYIAKDLINDLPPEKLTLAQIAKSQRRGGTVPQWRGPKYGVRKS